MAWRLLPCSGVLVMVMVMVIHQARGLSISISSFSHNATTQGASGPLCTHIGRHCLKNVSCVNQECVCPPGYKGNGLIECVQEKNHLCVVGADPHLAGYNKARADIDLPCAYRLTRFVTDHRTSETPFAYCSVEVWGTSELSYGRYYVSGIFISVGIVDSGKHVKDVFEVHKYGTNDRKVFAYIANMNHTRILWGSSSQEDIRGVNVLPTFDSDNNFAMLLVPQCEVRIKYRAFDHGQRRQSLLPGISIMAPDDSKFVSGYGTYPYSLCGTFDNSEKLYEERAEELGLRNSKLAVIYDVLSNTIVALSSNKRAWECKAASNAFKTSAQKVEDLNYCGDILTDTRTRLCIVASQEKYQPITVFTACMNFRHSGASADCQVLDNARRQCGRDWGGPDVLCGP